MSTRAFAVGLAVLLLSACPQEPSSDCAELCTGLPIPPPTCADADTAVTSALDPVCTVRCGVVSRSERCAFGCRDGQCLPNSTSDAGRDAGLELDAGVDAGAEPCAMVTCSAPPANQCVDAQRLEIFELPGLCAQGQCQYTSRVETCAGGCVNGACVNNPCQGVTCATPPSNACDDATTLRSFSPMGTCSAGACQYTSQTMPCTLGCSAGRCVNDPCAGVTCAQPPATFCATTSTLRSFSSVGACSQGQCVYTPVDTQCTFGCAQGQCLNDPCQGVACATPPATACLDSARLRTWSAQGQCSNGTCSYQPTDTTCPFGCTNGVCAGDPCLGLTCTTPPANTCVTPDSIRTHLSPGVCSDGACQYMPTVAPCPAAPAPTCVDSSTRRTFTSSCADGACGTLATDATCPGGCANGACVPVVCDRAQTRPCSSECFCEEFLIDDESLIDVLALSPTNVWACGTRGSLVHYDGSAWAKTPPLTGATLNALEATTDGTIWAVGSGGAVLRNQGGAWTTLDAGTRANLRAIDATSANAVWAVGSSGTVARWDGASWSVRDAGATVDFAGVSAASDVVLVGTVSGSTPVAYTATSATLTQTTVPSGTSSLTSVAPAVGGHTAVGFSGTLLNRSGSTWTTVTPPATAASAYLSRIRDGWVVGGRTLSGSGTSWSDLTTSVGSGWSGVSRVPFGAGGTFFVGGARAAYWDQGVLTQLSGGAIDFSGVWGSSANAVWLVGDDEQLRGRIHQWDGTRFLSRGIVGTWGNQSLTAVWGSGANDVYAVGADTGIVRFDGTSWNVVMYSPAQNITWQAVHGSSATNVWVVGYQRVRRFDGAVWADESFTGFGRINDVWTFSASQGWFVGQGGARRRSAASWSMVATGAPGELFSVWGSSANDVWVGGTSGFVARWNGTSFSTVATGVSGTIRSIWGRGPNDVFISGQGFVRHWNGTQFRDVDTGLRGTSSIDGIWADDTGATWFVGENGVARRKAQ